MKTTSVITFFDKKKEYRCLSNFWESKLIILDRDDGEERTYNSGELCFHGEKFIRLSKICDDEKRKRDLLEYGRKFLDGGDILTSKDARSRGGKGKQGFKLNEVELREWNRMSVEVQMEICKYKLENYEEVREWLNRSNGCLLIHPGMRCSEEKMKEKIWEGRLVTKEDGTEEILGGNKLGYIWMRLRDGDMV
jgi:predicted NAD-dependent protein-ADP-ribosyltransferase YbiA (DUF1768 family)